jgi:histidyl-tRNA synthetase
LPTAAPARLWLNESSGSSGHARERGRGAAFKDVDHTIAEWGAQVARVRINALGDKDSKLRFARELSAYLRRHRTHSTAACRARLPTIRWQHTACRNEACRKELLQGGPRAMNFLSEKSRAHFKEVLEHLEHLGLPYELDDTLVGDEREPRITFAIDTSREDATVVGSSIGGRYDDHVRKHYGRKEASVCMQASIPQKGAGPQL